MNEHIKVDQNSSTDKSDQTIKESGVDQDAANENKQFEIRDSAADRDHVDCSQVNQSASNAKCDLDKIQTTTRSLSLESVDSSINTPENADSSSNQTKFVERAKNKTDDKVLKKVINYPSAMMSQTSGENQEMGSRISKSVKFNPLRPEETERLYIKVHDEMRFNNLVRGGGKNGVPKFTPNAKPSPFKCNCVKFESPSSNYTGEHTCCPQHCPSRHLLRQRRSSGYSNFDDRSSSRSSNSAERGEYARSSMNKSNHVSFNLNSRRNRNSLDYQSSSWSRVRPANSSKRQHFSSYERSKHDAFNQNSKQLLMPIYKSNFREHTVTNSDDLSDEKMSRENARLKYSSRARKAWASDIESQMTCAEDYFTKFEEMLKQFCAWNSSSADGESHQKGDEFISLAQPLMNWFASNNPTQTGSQRSDSFGKAERRRRAGESLDGHHVEEAPVSYFNKPRVDQVKCGNSLNAESYHSVSGQGAEVTNEIHDGVHSLRSISSLSSPSCPSISSQKASIPNENADSKTETSNIAQNILATLNDELESFTMQSKLVNPNVDVNIVKCEFYQKKIIDLNSELNEIKNKNKNKQTKKFKIVARSEYEALKLQLQAFRDDYKLEHAEKEYYCGLCDQYVKKIQDLEELLQQNSRSYKFPGVQPAFNANDKSPKESSQSLLNKNKPGQSASNEVAIDYKSFSSLGADIF